VTDYGVRPIGWVRSLIKSRDQAPHQGRPAGVEAELVMEESVLPALDGMRGNPAIPKRGVFATRSPDRPNPIGMCLVDVLSVEGRTLKVRGLDALDGTPVVDLKPYRSSLDT